MTTLQLPLQVPQASRDRRSRILHAATRAFGANGFKGASLRDIATDAEVSLTLVTHHFGSKEQLLQAVVASHHEICKLHMAGFRNALLVDAKAATLSQLAAAWTRHEFELFQGEGGLDYLRLLVKLMNDDHVSQGLRQMLDCSEPVVLHALALAAPASTRADRSEAFTLARGALHAALLESRLAGEHGTADHLAIAIDHCADFVFAGLSASLL